MVLIQHLDLGKLGHANLAPYQSLTERAFVCCLEGKDPHGITDTKIMALEAVRDGRPIGLLLGSFHPVLRSGDLYSLFIKEEYRRQGHGTALMHAFIESMAEMDCSYITFRFPSSPYCEKILQKTGWGAPSLFVIKCLFEASKFSANWFLRSYRLPEPYLLFSWSELTTEDRHYVQHLIHQRGIPSVINPLLDEELIEPINSLGVSYHGKVVGWMITHRVDSDTIAYAKLYMLSEHRAKGNPMKMLAHSILLHQQSEVKTALFEVNLQQSDRSWISFIQKRLVPYAQSVTEIYQSICMPKRKIGAGPGVTQT